jgi:hypothetical protein
MSRLLEVENVRGTFRGRQIFLEVFDDEVTEKEKGLIITP